ncbi:hypothetical protein EJ357_07335 [Streptomyces cyaneochromogenes]|uniref:Lipoprotein n=1 Tax=Streptomyces cyaneochromogenes TaxID=2496836 RepID=A0A3S9M263_9ACTN|nr:hypothetical protein [Streptomyces cyaneochromogenes]AZQ33285.1 hypothetical protein EJ357_07335 [Streptomyces cyaneochromogenes]
MHRTTTTATLLVTVAVTALSGCTTVQGPKPPGPRVPTPSQPPAPRPGVPTERPVVQSPAREALTLIDPSGRPDPTPSTAHSASPAAELPAKGHPAPRSHPHRPRPERHEPHRPAADPPKRPPAKIPDVPEPIHPEAPKNADVCALGRKYGKWRADSPESRICDQTYGQ